MTKIGLFTSPSMPVQSTQRHWQESHPFPGLKDGLQVFVKKIYHQVVAPLQDIRGQVDEFG